MALEYRHNHYVPEWYQKRFLPEGVSRQYYLDLRPDTVVQNGHKFTRNARNRWGPGKCFAQDDLYTTKWGGLNNTDIEKFFFGKWDSAAPKALDHFASFRFREGSHEAFETILPYLSLQKLRTPQGIRWLSQLFGTKDSNQTLIDLQRVLQIFCATWTECVWQIADATDSPTKFIISDNPVVTYNRECQPNSKWCKDPNFPDIRFAATHTYFPLNPNKLLIFTNLTWVRDPFQSARQLRPNPAYFRNSMFMFTHIQVERMLSERDVLEINYITKMSADRYVASPNEEWLYPEKKLSSTNWRTFGDGYLFMPEPRHIHGGGEMFIGYEGGHSEAFSEYGHRPWQKGYKDEKRSEREWAAMLKFKSEWAATIGPDYRGVVYDMDPDNAQRSMGDDYYESECKRDVEYLKERGELSRRKKLQRSK